MVQIYCPYPEGYYRKQAIQKFAVFVIPVKTGIHVFGFPVFTGTSLDSRGRGNDILIAKPHSTNIIAKFI
jgi:hypothetical protein